MAGKGGYGEIFKDKEDDDVPFQMHWSADVKEQWYRRMLYFNWLRFVEYSLSGTDVLFVIALISGIVDYETLLLICTLSFSCMILGLIAEWALRNHTVIYYQSLDKGSSEVASIMKRHLKYCFWTSHLLAWVCIILPWHIIFQHYNGWFKQCGSETKPPDFIQLVVWLQVLLFASFGAVQLVQWWWPYKRRLAEVIYIALSISAKMSLGLLISANVLMQE